MNASDDNLIASIEENPIAQKLPERSSFIPLRDPDLRQLLADELTLTDDEQTCFNSLCAKLQALFHVEHLPLILDLEELYDSLDPDSQLVELEPDDADYQSRVAARLIDRLSSLLFSAHYKRLTREEIEQAIEVGCQWGVKLDVDFNLFERLEIFARGYRKVVKSRRRWTKLFREESIELPEFQRLIILFRVVSPDGDADRRSKVKDLVDSKFVYLKSFKNIPETDIEMLLPGTTVKLTKFDRAKILFPTLSGLAITIYKIARGVLVLSVAFTVHQLYDQLLGWLVFLGASGTYIVKSILSYFRTKSKYQFGLTKSLYLKNLENNLGVIYRVLNEAKEQELCEAILAYAMLLKHPDVAPEGITERDLDKIVESFLLKQTGVDVDFEVHDALGKLARLELVHVSAGGNWKVLGLNEATERLNTKWNEFGATSSRSI